MDENLKSKDLVDQNADDLAESKIVSFISKKNQSTKSNSKPVSRTISSTAQSLKSKPMLVSFDKKELNEILNVYGFKVAEGEWRDYAIDILKDKAIFSIFKSAREMPIHCIEKNPKLARKQGMYSITGVDGRILKRGHNLNTVLNVLRKKQKFQIV